MNEKITSAISSVKRKIDGQHPKAALNCLQLVSGIFDEALTNSEIDLAVDIIFNMNHGTVALLFQSLQYNKLFKECNEEILKLHLKIVREYSGKMPKYVTSVIKYSTKYIVALNVSAKEKELCMQIIHEMFLRKLCDAIDFPTVLSKIFRVFNDKDPPSRLLQISFEVVGLICKDFPQHVSESYRQQFHKAIFTNLDSLIIQKDKISLGTIAGALDGLNSYLINFSPEGEEGARECDIIYNCVKELSDVGDIREKALFRSAMLLLTSHTALIAEQLLRDHKFWHEALQKWLQLTYEDKRIAINAIYAVHKQLAITLTERSQPEDGEVLKFFFKYFTNVLQSSTSQPYDIRIAIQGFGLMAGPCKAIVPADQMENLLNLVIQATDHAYFKEKINKREHMEHLADFMESLSQIMAHMPMISRFQITSLENMMIEFIKDFHYLSRAHHEFVLKAFMNTFLNCTLLEGTVFQDIVQAVIKQGIIWTCRHKLPFDAFRDENSQDWKENITYKNYLPLWQGIFNSGKRPQFTAVSEKIYESFISSIHMIIGKLNLDTKKRTYKDENGKDEEFAFCDPNIDLEPVKPYDFNIFFNVIDLFRDVVYDQSIDHHEKNFLPWIPQFCHLIVINMQKYPLVSGFPKLLDLVLNVANKIKFFDEEHQKERSETHDIVIYLLRILIQRTQFTSGELQISYIQTIFSVPTEIVIRFLQDIIEVFKIAFEIGKSILWLANKALSALFRIVTRDQASDDVKEILEKVLPCLDVFLQSKGFSDPSVLSVEIVRVQNRRKIQRNFRQVDTDSELLKFQKRIYDFIGIIEPEMCLYLLNNRKHTATNLTKGDFDSSIKLKIHCTDVSPIICLDPLLPRVFQLALSSSDRKVKINACELLHGIVLYMIGIPVKSPKIWMEMWNQIIHLGCDADVAVQQMFEPLLMQIMHYKAQPNQDGINELLAALMENISHPSNAAVRDLSARCLREFVSWTLRQSTGDQVSASILNITRIVTQLEFYCWNFNVYHRLGASLAFNNLYRILREDESLLNRYWIMLAYLYCTNLKLCMKNFDSQHESMAIEQVCLALDHIVRVLCEKSDFFSTTTAERVKPEPLEEATLKHLALWIFHECGSHSRVYRGKCIELFMKIVPHVKEYDSPKKFIASCISNEEILQLCEGKDGNEGIGQRPDLTHITSEDNMPMKLIHDFLVSLLTDLDNQIWLFGGDLVQNPTETITKSKIFHAIDYYLENVCWKSGFDIIVLLNIDTFEEDRKEIEMSMQIYHQISDIKAILSAKLMSFLTKVVQFCGQDFPKSFWRPDSKIIKFILDLIFQPQELGLSFQQGSIEESLPTKTELVLTRIRRDAPKEFNEKLFLAIKDEFAYRLNIVTMNTENMVEKNSLESSIFREARGILVICKYVKVSTFPDITKTFFASATKRLLTDLFLSITNKRQNELYIRTLSHEVKAYLNLLLNIAFYNEVTHVCVIDCLYDQTPVKTLNASEKGCMNRGEYFLDVYRDELLANLTRKIDVTIRTIIKNVSIARLPMASRVIIELCKFIFDKVSEKGNGKILVDTIIGLWPTIRTFFVEWSSSSKLADLYLIELVSNIAMISPYPLWELATKLNDLKQWILDLISSKDTSMEVKNHALELLPTITGPQDNFNDKLTAALRAFQADRLPLISSEFKAESMERASLVVTFRTILEALVASQSRILLKFLIDATAGDENHIMEHEIAEQLQKCMHLMSDDHQVECIQLCFDVFCNTQLEPNIRLIVSRRFLKTIIRSCSTKAIITFFERNIKKVVELTDSSYGMQGRGWPVEQALVSRAGGYELIECLFSMVDKECLTTISFALLGTPGTEIVKQLTRKAFKVRSEIFLTSDETASDFYRKYQCHAYSALCTIVSNTQDQLKFYEGLLFKEDPAKDEYIWQRIINCKNNNLYSNLEQEFPDYPKVRDLMVSIKRLARKSEGDYMKFSHTNNVFMSSLSQEVTRFDFTHAAIRTAEDVANRETDKEFACVQLENDDINKHELMATLCALINHMYENKITPVIEDASNVRRIAPQWVEAIANAIYSRQQPKNVRIFLCKLVDNCRNVFKFYCSTLMAPLMQFIVDECAGNILNSFITDLVALILEWSEVYEPKSCDESSVASQMLTFLMKNCYHARTEIFKLNLDLINRLIHLWKDFVIIQKQVLYDLVTQNCSNDSKENICGLQLNAIVLSTGIIPWVDAIKVNYLKALFRCLDNDFKMIYQTASHLLGMCLKHINPDGEIEDDVCSMDLKLKIEAIKRSSEDKFINVIYGVQKNYPKILEPFMLVISHVIPNAFGAKKKVCLEMFLSGMEKYGDTIFRELMTLGIRDILKQAQHQLLGLHLINKAVKNMTEGEIAEISNDVLSFAESKNTECRDLMYEILVNMVQILKERSEHKTEIYKTILGSLLNGLSDIDTDIQNRIFTFWSNEKILSPKLRDRFLAILENLYDPKAEKHFLEYATQLLLDLPVQNPNSKDQLLLNQIENDYKLTEYEINVSWRSKSNHSLVPLFVESQQRQVIVGSSLQMGRMLRATASAEGFQPTQDPTTITKIPDTFALSTPNSLLFTLPPQVLDRNSRHISEATTSKPKPPLGNLRKRFIVDKEKSHKEHALKMIEKKHSETQKYTNIRRAKENEVVMYRRYRFGDFPDLLINGLALLLPLQALVKKDAIVARHIFMALYNGLISNVNNNTTTFRQSVSLHINEILNTSKNCESIIFATLMEVALSDPTLFNFSPDIVAISSIASNMVPSATLYIESCLNILSSDPSITSHGSQENLMPNMWLKLAELYQSISENDMVSSIFSDKLLTNPDLSRAIDCQSRGDLIAAQKIFIGLVASGGQKIEYDFCYESLYNCYEKMGKWSELAKIGKDQVDSWEELWTNEWDHENLLPCLIKANMRLMLQGKTESKEFIDILEGWLRVPEKANTLRTNYSEEIIMFQIANGDFRSARVQSEQNLSYFLSEWGHLSILSDKLRSEKIFNLRRVAEIHRCIEIILNDEKSERIEKLLKTWKSASPSLNDSLKMWDFLIAYRSYFGGVLKGNAADIDQCITEMKFKFFEAAIQQKNVQLSFSVLQSLLNSQSQNTAMNIEVENTVKLELAKCKLRNLKIENQHATETFKEYLKSSAKVNEIVTSAAMKDYSLNFQLQIYSDLIEVLKRVSDNLPRVNIDDNHRDIILNLTPQGITTDLNARLQQQNLTWLIKSVEVAGEIAESSQIDSKILGNTYYKMASYCYDRIGENNKSLSLEQNFILSVLRGMRYNSREARNLFPALLEMPNLKSNSIITKLFISESKKVPEWMFLNWVPQILSTFNFSSPCYLDKILHRLAQTYPAAIVYPFTLSYNQHLDMQNSSVPDRKLVTEIIGLTNIPGVSHFISALSCLCLPKLMLASHLTRFYNDLFRETHMPEGKKMKYIRNILKNVFREGVENLQGSAFKHIEKYQASVRDFCNESSVRNLLTSLDGMIKTLKEETNAEIQESIDLGKLCPWMINFKPTEESVNMELPGQYKGDQKPFVEHHVKIARFHQNLYIFQSLRKPMKLTITGTDGKSHEYLVKYGEDLRQDQRIQQLLQLMSANLQLDEQCKNHNLFIQTYQIIPMSQYCGITTWVHDTVIMKNFVKKSFSRHDALDSILTRVVGQFKEYFNISDGKLSIDYGNMVMRNSRSKIRKKFSELEKMIPKDLVRKALWDISISPECFFVLRNNFAKNLATMNIAHWILGIGDRHLGNLLFNTQNGHLVGIDFGMVFGGATINQPIPELIPFRLTPKMVNVMNPFGVSGLLKKCMIHALRSFRQCHKMIMACMSVFIQEPTLDWMTATNDRDDVSSQENVPWNYRVRIEIAKKKLCGSNPRALMAEELSMSVIANTTFLEGYRNILKGDEDMNVRTQLPDINLSVEDQVSCLIDLATDPAILGVCYMYFHPWI
ncbi:DNA-dependent protein kinase catalytic subunit-like [Phlebotomus argentipes]|uniref:DNA-dependent protein kinase catalytic subunit-like n=1 Tax=Phlebotomus argentipes TaxID=94469 RepID=UPI0028929A4E|nr:DNA-dependent protein kinase catalytic subunit-like [Phlebotomus argentipes]